MIRLSEDNKVEIVRMIENGKSLSHISKLFNKNKSTLYYYYKKTLGKKFKDVHINENDQMFIGELMGLFAGDGSYYYEPKRCKHNISFFFNITEQDYVFQLVDLFQEKLRKKPRINRVKNVLVLIYCSKQLANFLKTYVKWGVSLDILGRNRKSRTVCLEYEKYSDDFKIGFLRGFVDSDGYISKDTIMFSSASGEIINQTEEFLKNLGLTDVNKSFCADYRHNRVGMWHLRIRKSQREEFMRLINPRNHKHKIAPAGT